MKRADCLRACWVCLIITTGLLWLIVATGCGKSQRNTGKEKGVAPTSNLTRSEAISAAQFMCILLPRLQWSEVQRTGSMEPLINSYSIIVWEPSDGSDLALNQLVLFLSAGERVLHKVVALNATHLITDGGSNSRSDGWKPRDLVLGRLVSVIYTSAPL